MATRRASAGTSSADDSITLDDIADSGPVTPDDMPWMGNGAGTEPVDAIIVDDPAEEAQPEKSRLKTGWTPQTGKAAELSARGGIPTIDEWLDFFSRVVIRMATDFAIEMAFRGVDEDLLSDREIDTIKLDGEERDRIARPFAEFAYKNKYTKKHGREIIALSGSIDAILQLGIWYARMSKIAAKYKRMQGQQPRRHRHERTRAPRSQQHEQKVVVIQREQEVSENERIGQSAAHTPNGHGPEWRPEVGGTVYNPGG